MNHKSKGAGSSRSRSCRFSYVAWQTGYSDARFDGIDTSSELPCQCRVCRAAYLRGVDEGIRKALEVDQQVAKVKP